VTHLERQHVAKSPVIDHLYLFKVVAGPNGGFAFLSVENNQILLRPYSATGQPIGSALVVADSTADLKFLAVQLKDTDRVVVVWEESTVSGSNIYARLYDNWSPSDAVLVASTTTSSPPFQLDSLTSGGFVVSWLEGSTLKLRTFDKKAKALSTGPTVVSQTASSWSTEALQGGKFVVGWFTNVDLTNSNEGRYIYGQVFDKRGSVASAPFLIRTRYNTGYTDDDTGDFVFDPVSSLSFVAFPNGGSFIALWIETQGENYNSQTVLYGRNFASNGAATNPNERPILFHVLEYKALALHNGGWTIFAEIGNTFNQYSHSLVLKSFNSINDLLGLETRPEKQTASSSRRYPNNLLPSALFETTASGRTSKVFAIWSQSSAFQSMAYAFGLQCTIEETVCYDTFTKTSGEQLENTGITAQDQINPSIAVYPLTFDDAVVWQSASPSGGGNFDIAARYAQQVQASSVPATLNTNPSIGMTQYNNWFAVWQRLHIGANGSSSDWDIIGRQGYETVQYSTEVMVNERTALNQLNASVACSSLAATRCLVVWQGEEAAGNYNIYARFQQNALDPYDPIRYSFPEFRVNTDEGNHRSPKVTFLGDGIQYVITWQYQAPGSSTWVVKYKISDYFASVNPVTVLPGSDLKASTSTIGNELSPVVTSYANSYRFVIAWKAQQGNKIMARLFDLNGPSGRDFRVARVQAGLWGYPAVAPFYLGWVVAWHSQDGLWMKTYYGNQETALIQMNDTPVGDQTSVPSIASADYNTGVKAVWESNQIDGSGYGIVFRTFGCSA